MPLDPDELLRLANVRRLCASGEARRIRFSSGLSQAEVAATVGVSQPTVGQWERGVKPRRAAGLAYAALLDLLASSQVSA